MNALRRVAITLALAVAMVLPLAGVANAGPPPGCTMTGKASMLCKKPANYGPGQRPPSRKQWILCGAGFLFGGPLGAASFCLVDIAWRD